MPNQVETMAYAMRTTADVPWHGLGNPINPKSEPEEMLVQAGLDWTVSKRPLWTPRSPVFTANSGSIMPNDMMPINNYFSLVRDSDNKILGPAGKEYIPTQNREAFTFFKEFTKAGKMEMETAGSLQGGKQVWALAKLAKTFKLPGDDEIGGYLLLSSPHVWGKSLVIKFTTIRVVCHNTYTIAMGESSRGKAFRMPHIRIFDTEVQTEAAISLSIANELFEKFEYTANRLTRVKIDSDVAIRYIADLYHPEMITEQFGKTFYKNSAAKQAEMLLNPSSPKLDPSEFKTGAFDVYTSLHTQPGADLPSSKGTMWGAFNATTYHADHISGRDRDNALYSAWFGPKSVQKTQALQRAIQMAEVA